jgi:hypothetical protein
MANRCPNPNTFAGTSPPWPLASLDQNNVNFFQGTFNDASLGWVNGVPADTGTANLYSVTLPFGAPSSYNAGMTVVFTPANTNTGSSTITVAPLGSILIKTAFGNALVGGELPAGVTVMLVCDGTAMRIMGGGGTLQSPSLVYATDTGTANAYAAAVPVLSAYAKGNFLYLLPANTNTGASTLTLNALTAVPIVNKANLPLAGSEIIAGTVFGLIYDGTSFRIVTPTCRFYTGLSPGNVTIDCNGYDRISVYILYNGAVGTTVTLTHLASGTAVSITFANAYGSAVAYAISASDPANNKLTGIYTSFPSSTTGGTQIVLQSGNTVNSQNLNPGAQVVYTGVSQPGYLILSS